MLQVGLEGVGEEEGEGESEEEEDGEEERAETRGEWRHGGIIAGDAGNDRMRGVGWANDSSGRSELIQPSAAMHRGRH